MNITNRANTAHGVLVFLELAAALVATLVTVFALLLAEGVASIGSVLGNHPSIDARTVDVGIALLTTLLLASLGGFAVIGYHDFFDRSFGNLGLHPMAIVPLVGIVVPAAYVSRNAETASLPAWSFAIVFVSSYVLALRFVAVHSMLERWRKAAVIVGIGTCVPAAVALMQFVTDAILWGGEDHITAAMLSVATENGVPPDRRLFVAVPLSVAALLGIHRIVSTIRRWASAGESPGVSAPTPGRSSRRTTDRVRERVPTAASIRSSRKRLGLSALASLSSSNSASSSRSSPSRSLSSKPASSPGSAAAGSSGRSSSAGSSGPAAGSSSTGSSAGSVSASKVSSSAAVPPPSSPSPDRRSKRADRDSSSGDGSADDSSSTDERGSTGGGSRSQSSDRSGAATDGDGDAGSTGTASSARAGETGDDVGGADSSEGGTGSDTRIFTDDFDQYGTDGDPVEHCPDCGKTLPSDGVYRFCPFCGHEV